MALTEIYNLPRQLRRSVSAFAVNSLFHTMSGLGHMELGRHEGVRIKSHRNLRYLDSHSSDHTLDVYRPDDQAVRPVVVYVHGGGFQILSKDTHWMMAEAFARAGFVVANINYRLSPDHKYPEPLSDVCAAIQWVIENASRFGGDPKTIVLAGESAGANLVTAAAIAMTTRRDENWARELFDMGVAPAAIIPACGILQLSDVDRHRGDAPSMPSVVFNEIAQASRAYLPEEAAPLADPLLRVEEGLHLERPWPATLILAGSRDPLVGDSRRLYDALRKAAAPVELREHEGEHHSFHAFFWRKAARLAWDQTFDFLEAELEYRDARRLAS